jgi:renalase
MNDLHHLSLTVIGAGLAGIAAARTLTERGARVTILEKSRGCGGRCATKRWQGHVIDHGAQYFTQRDPRFAAATRAACGQAVQRLDAPVVDRTGHALPDDGRWFHRDGNSRLVRALADGLEVRTETTVTDARRLLRAAGGDSDAVISTAPWPQTATLFGLTTATDDIPCLAAILVYRGDGLGRTADAYAVRDPAADLAWSACENHKPGRVAAGSTVLVAHAGEAFSRAHLDHPPAGIPGLLRGAVEAIWKLPATAFIEGLGHRWRFARSEGSLQPPPLPPGLYYVGDALRQSRVEDAWLAGHTFAQTWQPG